MVFLLVLVILSVLAIKVVDALNTKYLKISNNPGSQNQSYIIANVHVIPMTQDTVMKNKMVYIKNGVIDKISDSLAVQNIEVVDGNNQYLLPGLMDMHVHVWDKYELGLYLSNGVTAIRNVWGMPMHLRLKDQINKEKLWSPALLTTGPKLTGPEFIGDDNTQLKSPEEAREKVKAYKKRGYDLIKTYYNLPKDYFDAILEQAKRSQMDIVAHPSQKVPYAYHFKPQIKSVEHAEDIVQQPLNYTLDTVKLNQVVHDFSKAKNTSLCPTLIAYYNIYNMLVDDGILESDQAQMMNASIRKIDSKGQFERWRNTKKQDSGITQRIKSQHEFHLLAIKKLNDAGVNIICGTDAGIGVTAPGFSIHDELGFYKEAGLTNYQVLKTATVNASKVHKAFHDLGTVEVGKTANLILVEENPLTNLNTLKNPSAVFIKGRKIDRNKLHEFQEEAKNRKNFLPSILNYVEYLSFE